MLQLTIVKNKLEQGDIDLAKIGNVKTAGNRFNLRSQWYNQIKKTDAVNSVLGSLSNVLVTTWGGLFMGIGTLGIGVFLIVKLVTANGAKTLVANIPAILMVVIGFILIALNVVLTNPTMGSQLKVSLRFIAYKVANFSTRHKHQSLRNTYRISSDDPDVIEINARGRRQYMAMYQVRGTISPVTFDDELERLERVNGQLLTNLGRDVQITKLVEVQTARVMPVALPKNATQGMRDLAKKQYQVARVIPDNQQLTSYIMIIAPSTRTLYEHLPFVETAFSQGLVISSQRLSGEKAKKEISKVYGTDEIKQSQD